MAAALIKARGWREGGDGGLRDGDEGSGIGSGVVLGEWVVMDGEGGRCMYEAMESETTSMEMRRSRLMPCAVRETWMHDCCASKVWS